MTLIVNCTKCGKELRSQDRFAGKPVRCSQCGTINRLPSRPSDALPPVLESAFCFVCGKDFTVDSDLVRDKKGRSYHRRCYEEASRYEKSRREQEVRRHKSDLPRHLTPQSLPRHATPADPIDEELVELIGLTTSPEESWPDLSPSSPDETAAGSLIGHGSRREGVWLYVLIGFGAAVPVVVLLFILVQLIISSIQGPPEPPKKAVPLELSEQPPIRNAPPLRRDQPPPRAADSP